MNTDNDINTIELATDMTIAWLSNPNTRAGAEDASSFLLSMKDALDKQQVPEAGVETDTADLPQPAVSVRKSLASKDHLISMIDGKPYKTLRRHIATHGMTPQQYRERFGLRHDYPMVASTYSEARREMAKKIGLGTKRGQQGSAPSVAAAAAPATEAAPAPAPRRRGRPPVNKAQ